MCHSVIQNPPYLVGKMLLAMPGIGDSRFNRAAIAMCAHDENGALGIDIGKIVPRLRLHDLLGQLDIEPGRAPNCVVHAGGPVEQQRGFVLHGLDWGGDGTIQVANRWGLTGTIDALRAIAEGRGPTRWLVALGYAGWGEGQLEGELARPGWHVADGDDGVIFGTKPAERWATAFAASGIDPRMLSPSGGRA